jgi:thioredoxin 2
MNAPELEKTARAGAGKWIVAKVDTEARQDLAAAFRIVSLPTMVLIVGGREHSRISGARSARDLVGFIQHVAPADNATA